MTSLLASSFSNAAELDNCLVEKYSLYTKAKEKWQIESTDLIVRHSPHLKDVAELYKNEQLIRIKKNQLAVDILIGSNSEFIDVNKNLRKWLSLSSEAELSLANKSLRYKELLKSVKSSGTRAPHPDGDKLRRVVRSKIMGLPKFQLLLKNFNIEVEKVNHLQCVSNNAKMTP